MKENNNKKMKSIATVMFLLLSAISAFVIVMPSSVADTWYTSETEILITSPTNDSLYFLQSLVTVTWENASSNDCQNIDGFYINASGPAWNGGWETIHNITSNTTLTWNWNVSDDVSRGDWGFYKINVTGYSWGTGPRYTGAGIGGNWTVHVRIMPTPGVNAWQGGNWNLTTNFSDNKVLVTSPTNLKYNPDTTIDIVVDDTRAWNETRYQLYKPHYNSSELTWEVVTSSSLDETSLIHSGDGSRVAEITFENSTNIDNTFKGVTLDCAGLWLISERRVRTGANDETIENWITDDVLRSYSTYNSTMAGWFWVNTTTDDSDFVFSVSETSFAYNASGTITLSVKDATGNGVEAIVDVRLDSNESSIASGGKNVGLSSSGEDTYIKNNSKVGKVAGNYNKYDGFWCAGNYTAYAYDDLDAPTTSYTANNLGAATIGRKHYNSTYGAGSNWYNGDNATWTPSSYMYGLAGPWDPPELDATPVDITVEPAEPYIVVSNTTQYWGFDGTVNITIREGANKDGSFTASNVYVEIYDDDDVHVSSAFGGSDGKGNQIGGGGAVDDSNVENGFIEINMTQWGKNLSGSPVAFADNGTWYAKIYVDFNGDRTEGTRAYSEEWNGTAEWTVKKAPNAQFKWIDDDGDVGWNDDDNTNTDGYIPYIPTVANVPLYVQFQVLSQGGTYFGDFPGSGKCNTLTECMENITLTGDALFTGTFDKIPGVDYEDNQYPWCGAANTWTVPIIPTMSSGGGTITITAKAFNSTTSGTLTIGGGQLSSNGTVLTVTPNEFMIDQNQTLTIQAVDPVNPATIETTFGVGYLYYLNDTGAPYTGHLINDTHWKQEYKDTIPFKKSEQKANQTSVDFDGDGATADSEIKAPRNLTVYFDGFGSYSQGYALVKMNPISDLELEISHDTFMSGYAYDDFYINCTIAGSNGSSTPNTAATDRNNFHIIIFDSKGNDVSSTLLNGIDSNDLTGDSNYIYGPFNNVYATTKGTYTVYAKNNTHNSYGYNATLTVNPVSVVCNKDPLIWQADENITATFTITYNGEPVEGSLRLDNISTKSPTTGDDYNRTWANTSFNVATQVDDATGTPTNASLVIDEDDITSGVAIVNDLSADWLRTGETNQTITFFFKPSQTSSVYGHAGTMKVRIPTVSPDPAYIPLGETTRVLCSVTGRGTALNNVFVRAFGLGVDTNGTTNAAGEIEFSLTPSSTGNISLDVGEEGRTLDSTEAVIQVTTWKLDISVSPDTVDEGDDFTVTVTEENSGDAIEGATVTINGIGTATTDTDGEATFTAPTITSDRSYTVKASKAGYAPETDTVTVFVTNIPELVISSDSEVQAGATFEVAVAKDTGDPVVGATVTFNGETYKTKAGGVVTVTAPDKEGDYTITASFKDFVSAQATITVKPGTPGFELLTLIAAIGVAFILLRRRRKK